TIQIGNSTSGTTVSVDCAANPCNFGTTSVSHTTGLGSSFNTSTTNVNAGTGGLNLGNNGVANTIQIGNLTGAVAQTINIGTNATASSTNNVNIGSTVAGTTTLQSSGVKQTIAIFRDVVLSIYNST